jgi:hypothetical protein
MKRTLLAGVLALSAILGSPRQARADCLIESVASCNDDFGGNSNYYTIAIRGWCYMIRAGLCAAGSD